MVACELLVGWAITMVIICLTINEKIKIRKGEK